MTNNRKRPRSIKEENECLPLSKRINNLDYNNRLMLEKQQGQGKNPKLYFELDRMTNSRKRPRSSKDEAEYVPLSKRINNLHINNSLMLENQQGNSQNPIQDGPGPPYNMPDLYNTLTQQHYPQQMCVYSPELDESQNPHYFNINRLLYEMYLERSRREQH